MSSNVKKKGSAQQTTRSPEARYLLLLPVLFVVAILPLIVRYHEYPTKLENYTWFAAQEKADDYFLYWKQQWFIIMLIFMVCIVAVRSILMKKQLSFHKIFIPIFVYAALAFLSTIFSKYRSYGFTGIFQQFESVWVLLGYAVVVYYVYLMVETEKDVSIILNALLCSAIFLGVLGASQAFGKDFWLTSAGLSLIYPANMKGAGIQAVFGEKRVYMSLYNPNYVGVYTALVVPVFVTLLSFCRNWKKIVAYLVAIAGILVGMFGSQSKAGLVGIAAAAGFLIIMLRKYLFRRWYIPVGGAVIIVCGFLIINAVNHNAYLESILNLFRDTKTEEPALSEIQTLDDCVEITYKGNKMKISSNLSENSFEFLIKDQEDNILECDFNADTLTWSVIDERFLGIIITPVNLNGVLGFSVVIDGKSWYFANQLYENDASYYYWNIYGKFDKIIMDEPAFRGIENFATNRGFIWAHTFPLLKKYIFLGAGAESFVFVYPQRDYVNLYNYGYGEQLLTKPHNLYLQIAIQTGVVSLTAFLLFYLIYFISGIRLYFKCNFDTPLTQAGVGIMAGTFGYMVMGLTNDSCITVAPVYWVLLGLGVTINLLVKKQKTV